MSVFWIELLKPRSLLFTRCLRCPSRTTTRDTLYIGYHFFTLYRMLNHILLVNPSRFQTLMYLRWQTVSAALMKSISEYL